ncbi:hypothetical protein [Qipengyuania sp.]|uniref:hypothetical protein n=1 Tax=Qipengyuania sp. TaxID=2004515 RepID=UPI003735EFA6
MVRQRNSKRTGGLSPLVLAVAVLGLSIPGAGLAVAAGGGGGEETAAAASVGFLPFTPAGADPELAQKVAKLVGTEALRFTPASNPNPMRDRTVTFAVRVDEKTARAIGGRTALKPLVAATKGDAVPLLASTRYNLGIARGYQGFAKAAAAPVAGPAKAAPTIALRDFAMPDLRQFKAEENNRPSRFQSRVALEQEDRTGRAPRTLEGAGEQRLDVSGSYRVLRNLDVTAGVRLSQERDRLDPLTSGVEDDQAVYVGTQLKF